MRRGAFIWAVTIILVLPGIPVVAASRLQAAAERVYAKIPNLEHNALPGQPDNTLVRRLINYHATLRGRPEYSRLDWKLTLADYLGYNLPIDPTTYPDNGPGQPVLAQDRAAIDALSRPQRNRLIEVLIWSLEQR
ncbi:hypothetical protein [Gloeobacter kilaueensis]|uniref:Uncharacterized protein n=1 Tax=Gloeobacter kilaueensis (strain ATCC BAA-2537 / CCAP 1431/1 / ULC 316 / JS1) TaxID=1183438 RepID=U5QIY4_GLOK1|nr:hypothetical protein [Gloeobacter kilaueensis]AGY58937.1 hypothetical protein GKIL_2691 [Gloeobacter kilaueensis JS1]